jgi:hypothetical protein
MKRASFIILIMFLSMQLIQVDRTNPKIVKNMELNSSNEFAMKIFKDACYDCHSNETKWPWYSYIAPMSWTISKHVKDGRRALNFSNWNSYTDEEKREKQEAIFRTIYISMPLSSYVVFHKEADISHDDRTKLRKWLKSEKL